MMLSIVIATYRREQELINTIQSLQPQRSALPWASELLIIDQTETHRPETEHALAQWQNQGEIRWIQRDRPHLTQAMNTGLVAAHGDIVLFLDDDIIPLAGLLQQHVESQQAHPDAWAVVGQILQPGQHSQALPQRSSRSDLWRDLDFPFNSSLPATIENAMGGNLSVKRSEALAIGGFDEAFPPPVASRFESEFAKRLVRHGGKIYFEPRASLHHLAARSGGTRSEGSHLTSASPRYGIGDFYFALRCGHGWDRLWYVVRKPFREVRTKFHLHHPWWIPVKFWGELRALVEAIRLWKRPPLLLHPTSKRRCG